MEIREADLNNLDALTEPWFDFMMHHQQYSNLADLEEDLKEKDREKLEKAIESEDRKVLVAEADDLIGFAIASIEDHPDIFKEDEIGVIDRVFVREEFRGENIGSEMADRVIEWFEDKQVGLAKTRVLVDNEGAQNFWYDQGFDDFISVKFKKLED